MGKNIYGELANKENFLNYLGTFLLDLQYDLKIMNNSIDILFEKYNKMNNILKNDEKQKEIIWKFMIENNFYKEYDIKNNRDKYFKDLPKLQAIEEIVFKIFLFLHINYENFLNQIYFKYNSNTNNNNNSNNNNKIIDLIKKDDNLKDILKTDLNNHMKNITDASNAYKHNNNNNGKYGPNSMHGKEIFTSFIELFSKLIFDFLITFCGEQITCEDKEKILNKAKTWVEPINLILILIREKLNG